MQGRVLPPCLLPPCLTGFLSCWVLYEEQREAGHGQERC